MTEHVRGALPRHRRAVRRCSGLATAFERRALDEPEQLGFGATAREQFASFSAAAMLLRTRDVYTDVSAT